MPSINRYLPELNMAFTEAVEQLKCDVDQFKETYKVAPDTLLDCETNTTKAQFKRKSKKALRDYHPDKTGDSVVFEAVERAILLVQRAFDLFGICCV